MLQQQQYHCQISKFELYMSPIEYAPWERTPTIRAEQ